MGSRGVRTDNAVGCISFLFFHCCSSGTFTFQLSPNFLSLAEFHPHLSPSKSTSNSGLSSRPDLLERKSTPPPSPKLLPSSSNASPPPSFQLSNGAGLFVRGWEHLGKLGDGLLHWIKGKGVISLVAFPLLLIWILSPWPKMLYPPNFAFFLLGWLFSFWVIELLHNSYFLIDKKFIHL